jgi:hypothetical protein
LVSKFQKDLNNVTRFFQVFIFKEDEEEEIELPFTEEELKDKFDGKLEKEMKGPSYEVLSKLLKVRLTISFNKFTSFNLTKMLIFLIDLLNANKK